MAKYGIDVSDYQSIINWDKVKSQIDFAILRIGWVGNKENHTLDEQFERNYSECKRLGIPVGVYVYNYCNCEETAKSGANWVIQKLQGKTLDLPVYFDMEDKSIENLGKNKLSNIVIAFNTVIENAGFWAGIYANLNWYNNYLNKDDMKKRYTSWIAHYTDAINKYEGEYDMWQSSNSGKISGINGNVDTNWLYRDLMNDIKNSSNKVENKYYKQCAFFQTSLVDALKSIGEDSSYNNRKKIALKNGITNYLGTAKQNTRLLNLLKNGKLLK